MADHIAGWTWGLQVTSQLLDLTNDVIEQSNSRNETHILSGFSAASIPKLSCGLSSTRLKLEFPAAAANTIHQNPLDEFQHLC